MPLAFCFVAAFGLLYTFDFCFDDYACKALCCYMFVSFE
jgi:hypothetical protein